MKLKGGRLGWLVTLLLAPALAGAQGMQQSGWPERSPRDFAAPSPSDSESVLQQRLSEARERLGSAVREVGELRARIEMEHGARVPGGDALTRSGEPPPRAMLGVVIVPVRDGRVAEGVRVTGVTPGGPADEAGVQVDDLIVEVNGEALADGEPAGAERRLVQRMRAVEPGDSVRLRLLRDGGERELTLRARAFEPAAGAATAASGQRLMLGASGAGETVVAWPSVQPVPPVWHPWADMELAQLSPELGRYFSVDRGLLVVRAPSDGSLELRDGDVILNIGGRYPEDVAHALRILGSYAGGETLPLSLMRDHRREELEVRLPVRQVRGPQLLREESASGAGEPADAPARR